MATCRMYNALQQKTAVAMWLALCGGLWISCQKSTQPLTVDARMLAPGIRECSGIVPSRQFAGVFWVHNDSGNAAQLFAIDAQGNLLRKVAVLGVSNIDWEDITTDDAGNLYVGDFGNNRNDRRNLEVLVIREPDPRGSDEILEVVVERRIPFFFPEQKQFPNRQAMNFDCEAIFCWMMRCMYSPSTAAIRRRCCIGCRQPGKLPPCAWRRSMRAAW